MEKYGDYMGLFPHVTFVGRAESGSNRQGLWNNILQTHPANTQFVFSGVTAGENLIIKSNVSQYQLDKVVSIEGHDYISKDDSIGYRCITLSSGEKVQVLIDLAIS